MNSSWQDVVKTAIIGTGRRALKSLPDNQLGEMLSRLDSDDEGTLLAVAGAIALYQQAGKLLNSEQQTLPADSEDDLPCCSLGAGQHLALMLGGKYTKILPEWLAVAAETGKRVPPGCLTQLLTLGQRQRNLRELILPVLGKRGFWLAAQNPDWNYAVSESETDNSLSPRQLFLKRLREKDPDAARKQLEATWNKENSEERASLLQVLEINLSMNDEPFLEAALDNRRKQVRDVAANLLAKLPSRLVQRMIQRVRPLITFSDNLQVTLPKSCDSGMTRDGIDESRYSPMLGEKASWLLQMISYVPPSFWCDSGRTPKELLQTVAGSEWEKLLLEAWGIAAVRSRDLAWAEVLLSNCGKFNDGYLVSGELLIQDLLKVMPEDGVNALILQTLLQSQTQLLNQKHPAFLLLTKSRYPWSVEISNLVLSSIRRHVEVNSIIERLLRSALENFAFYMNVSVVHEAATSLSGALFEGSYWQDFVDEFLATLLFRFEMIQALRGE